MDFESNFAKLLVNDLEQGLYGDGEDFAKGITRHYMSSLSLNAPAGIPLTMPSPLAAGAPVPVGPSNSITNLSREKVFYNTIRAYFVGKEITQGKIQIRSLAQDVQSAIKTYNKLSTDVKNLQIQVQQLDDRLEQLRADLKAIKPELKKFIQSKKDILKEIFNEINALGDRAKQLSARGIAQDFNYSTLIEKEVADLKSLLDLKIEPSLNYLDIEETFQTLLRYAAKSKTTLTKYKNTFTKEANLTVYISKKVKTAVDEIMRLLNGFIQPEKFKSLWNELLYVPGAGRIAKIMLKIVNDNVYIKEKKKQLLIKLESTKQSVRAQLDKKLDDLQAKLQKVVEDTLAKIRRERQLNKKTKAKERRRQVRRIKLIITKVKNTIRKIRRYLAHCDMVVKSIQSIFTKLFRIYATLKESISNSKETVDKIVRKYKEITEGIEESFSPEARAARRQALTDFKKTTTVANLEANVSKMLSATGDTSPVVSLLMQEIQSLYKLNPTQLAAFFRQRSDKAIAVARDIESILTYDIPRVKKLIRMNPNDVWYDFQMQQLQELEDDYNDPTGGAKGVVRMVVRGEPDKHMTYLRLIRSCRVINDKLTELQYIIDNLVEQKTAELLNAGKEQSYLETYVNELLDVDGRAKKIRNKKRKKEFDIAKAREKVAKFRKLAKEARLAYSIVANAPRVFIGLVQNTEAPITQNEADVRSLINNFLELQVERGKIPPERKDSFMTKYNRQIDDLKAYEQIYIFFKTLIKESKDTTIKEEIKKAYEKRIVAKAKGIQTRGEDALNRLITLFEDTTKSPSIIEIAALPSQLFADADAMYAIVRAEKAAFGRLRTKIKGLSSFIPNNTGDPILLFIRRQLDKGSNLIITLLDGVAKFFKKIVEFIEDRIVLPVTNFLKDVLSREEEKLQEDAVNYTQSKVDAKVNLDAKIMSLVFGLAGKLFWIGNSWTNPVGTKFIVTNVGRFSPQMQALSENGAQGYADELAWGFDTQLSRMSGIAIPPSGTGILPFTWRGYLSKQDYIIGY